MIYLDNNNHLLDILRFINNLQRNVSSCDINNNCLKPILGLNNTLEYNTRPVAFYLCNNELLTVSYTTSAGVEETTSVFRVENVSNNCVTLRLLQEQDDGTYTNTNEFATINIDCICAIRCLADAFVPL